MFHVLLSLFAGVLVTFQTAFNTRLGKDLDSPSLVALVSCLVGSLGLALYLLVARETVPRFSVLMQEPAWLWLGGALGATYVLISVLVTPRVGVGTLTALVIAGQMVVSVLLDHYGFLGLDRHGLNAGRVGAVLLFCAGAELLRRS